MPKIKLIKVFDNYCGCCDYIDTATIDSHSEWEEVTDEELSFLLSNEGKRVLNPINKYTYKVFVLEDETNTGKVQDFIHDIKDYIQKQKEKLEKAKTKQQKMLEEKKVKSDAKKIQEAKNLLEKIGIKLK